MACLRSLQRNCGAEGTKAVLMGTPGQRKAASRNIVKAQARWREMSPRERAQAQPEGRARQRPGAGGGRYFRVEVRPKSDFIAFRTQDVGRKGHIQRVAGKRASGSWGTVTWLISKQDAHLEHGRLVGDSAAAKKLIDQFASSPIHVQGDRFRAADRPNVPERSKPTVAQQRARKANIRKALAARHKA